MLANVAMLPPIFFVDDAIGIGLFNPGDELALSLLFGLTGPAAYFLGGILVMLAYLDGEEATADPHLQRVALPLGARGRMNALRVFTARSTGIGIATGALVACAFAQLLGAAWGLAALNGLAAGALALALSSDDLRGGWFDTTRDRRRTGIRALAYAVMMAPTLFAHRYIEVRPADEVAVSCCSCSPGSPPTPSAASWRLWYISTTSPPRPTRACIASPRRPASTTARRSHCMQHSTRSRRLVEATTTLAARPS